MENFEDKAKKVISKFDKQEQSSEANFESRVQVLSKKLFELLDHPSIASNEYAGIREQIAYASNFVNNELSQDEDKLNTIFNKLHRIGDGYDISGPEFEDLRRKIATASNYVLHKMMESRF